MKQGKMMVRNLLPALLLIGAIACALLLSVVPMRAHAAAEDADVHGKVYDEYTVESHMTAVGNYGIRNRDATDAATMYIELTVSSVSPTPYQIFMGASTEAGKNASDWRNGANNFVYTSANLNTKLAAGKTLRFEFDMATPNDGTTFKCSVKQTDGTFGETVNGGTAKTPNQTLATPAPYRGLHIAFWANGVTTYNSDLVMTGVKIYDSNGQDLGVALRAGNANVPPTLTKTYDKNAAATAATVQKMKTALEDAYIYTVDMNESAHAAVCNTIPLASDEMYMYMDFSDVTITAEITERYPNGTKEAGLAGAANTTQTNNYLYAAAKPNFYQQDTGSSFMAAIAGKKVLYRFIRNSSVGELFVSADGETYEKKEIAFTDACVPANAGWSNTMTYTPEELSTVVYRGLQLNGATMTGKLKAAFASSAGDDLGVLAALNSKGDGIVQSITVSGTANDASLSGYKTVGTVLDFAKAHYTASYTVNGGDAVTADSYTVASKTDATIAVTYVPVTYTVTFTAGGQTVDTQTYTVENDTVTEPTVPAKAGYTGAWANYTLDGGDKTVEAVYTPDASANYVTFRADGKDVGDAIAYDIGGTVTEPAVPAKTGYTGVWESYTLSGGPVIVNAKYTLITYTVTFKADGETVGTQVYTVEDKTVEVPDVPDKTGYTGKWESYVLDSGDKTVNAVYEAIVYTVTFKADGVVVTTLSYSADNKNITEPAVPDKAGYTGKWATYTLDGGNKIVEAEYTKTAETDPSPAKKDKKCGGNIGGTFGGGCALLLFGAAAIAVKRKKKA